MLRASNEGGDSGATRLASSKYPSIDGRGALDCLLGGLFVRGGAFKGAAQAGELKCDGVIPRSLVCDSGLDAAG